MMRGDKAAKEPAVDQAQDTPCRETARTILAYEIQLAEQTCQRTGMEALQLRALANCLPAKLNPDADQALYDLLMIAKRRKGIV
jgi:hypothetical protein